MSLLTCFLNLLQVGNRTTAWVLSQHHLIGNNNNNALEQDAVMLEQVSVGYWKIFIDLFIYELFVRCKKKQI